MTPNTGPAATQNSAARPGAAAQQRPGFMNGFGGAMLRGLVLGGLIGLLLAPSNVPTMGGLWRAADGTSMARGTPLVMRAAAYTLVAAILAAGTLAVTSGVV
jgi:hypothetical protein